MHITWGTTKKPEKKELETSVTTGLKLTRFFIVVIDRLVVLIFQLSENAEKCP